MLQRRICSVGLHKWTTGILSNKSNVTQGDSQFYWVNTNWFKKSIRSTAHSPSASRKMTVPLGAEQYKPKCWSEKPFFIDGEFQAPSNYCVLFESFDPCTGQSVASIPSASSGMVDRAVEAAAKALPPWKLLSGRQRAAYLRRLSDIIADNSEKWSLLESFDSGKPLRESRIDMEEAVRCLRVNAAFAEDLDGMQDKAVDIHSDNYRTRLRYEPFGVVSLITPWNYPLLMAMQKVASALAAGCTCVLKPSENASITCVELADACRQADLPKGVLNILTGLGAITGPRMVSHPLVSKVSFTGSVATGSLIMKMAAEAPKPVHLELGGKSPMLIFDDVDIPSTVDWIMTGIFWGTGQVCSATSRVMVHEKIYDKVCEQLKHAAGSLIVGPVGNCEQSKPVDMGPVVSEAQYRKVLKYIQTGEKEGLRLLFGGSCDRPANVPNGYFVQPTIFADVPECSTLWQEEIFGPVLCLRSFSTEDEAIKMANATSFGLAAAIMTSDKERAARVSSNLEAGMIWENCSQPVFQEQPFGGFKKSGFGKECGREGFMEFLQVKTVTSCMPGFCEKSYIKL